MAGRRPRPAPPSWAPGCSTDYPLEELVPIDWTPFFQTWELPGHYPAILTDPVTARAAVPLFEDAQRLLARIVRDRLLTAKAVVGFWPANASATTSSSTPTRPAASGAR